MSFDPKNIDKNYLLQHAYNMRWAEVQEGVIPLTAADLDFPCAAPIRTAIKNYTDKGYFNYGPAEGLPVLKEELSAFLAEKRDVSIPAKNILPVDSAAFGIYIVCKTFLKPGDEAIIFDPVDFLFRYSIESVGATAVSFSILPGTEKTDFSAMEALISSKTKLICLCNPLNPTGKVFTKEELTALGSIAQKHGLIILSDEIWSDIVFAPHKFTSVASLGEEVANRTIIVTGFSKSYGLAGLRIGAVIAPNNECYADIVKTSLHHSTIHGANVLSQVAAAAALSDCGEWLSEFLLHLTQMRDLCVKYINALKGFSCIVPEGCYLAFANIQQTGMSSQQMSDYLLKEAKVAVVPGLKQWFGPAAEGYIRFSFATSAEIISTAFERIEKSISKL